MKVIWLPHSLNPVYAGVRLRCLFPLKALRDAGHQASLGHAGADLAAADVLVVQAKCLLDAGSPQAFEAWVARLQAAKAAGASLVLDSFDNYFLNSQQDPVRARLLNDYRQALGLFDRFIVSSPGLLPYLREVLGEGARIDVVGDPLEGPGANQLYESSWQRCNPRRWAAGLRHQASLIALRKQRRTHRQLMWFGNHGSAYAAGGMAELALILPQLKEASTGQPLTLTVVSNSRAKFEQITAGCGFSCRYLAWDRLHFADLLQQQDLVLLPARVNAFTASKSNNRLLLPLSMGVPVMASPLPDYLPWREHCAMDEWDQLAAHLQDLGPLRQKAAAVAPMLRQQFSVEAIGRQWVAALARRLSGLGRR